MKAVGTCACVCVGLAAGMAAGAWLVMSKPEARKVYRIGRHYAKQMLGC